MPKSNLCLNIENPVDQAYYEVDLFNSQEVKIGLSIFKFTQFNQPKSTVISDIQIVVNEKSDKVFGKIYRGDYDPSIVYKSQYNCVLLVDNYPIYGVLNVDEILHKPKSRVITYKTSITGTRYIWINEIADRSLRELDLGYIIFTTDLVQRSWDRFGTLGSRADTSLGDIPIPLDPSLNTGAFADPDDGQAIFRDAPFDHTPWTWRHDRTTNEGGIVFTPVHYGSWEMQLDPFGIDYPSEIINGVFAVRVQDLRPSVYVKWIVENIFTQWTDYTLVSDIFNTELFEGLILPYTSGDEWLPDLDDYEIIVGTTAVDFPFVPSSTGIFIALDDKFTYNGHVDTLDLWNSVNVYTTDRIITTKFIWEFELEDTDPAYTILESNYTDIVVELYVNSVLTQAVTIPINGRSFSTEDDTTTYSTPGNPAGFEYMTLPAGASVYYEYYPIPNNNPSLPSGNVPIVDMTFRNVVRKNIPSDGIQIDIAPLLHPDLTVKSLLDGLTHMFNLIIITDPINKTVRIESDESAYLRGRRLVDWSGILDCGVDIVQKFDSAVDTGNVRGYTLKYKQDSADGFVEELETISGSSIYSQDVSLFDDIDSRNDLKVYENPTFAATWFLRDWDTKPRKGDLIASAPPIWPRLWEEYEDNTERVNGLVSTIPLYTGRDPKYSWVPRILYYNGAQWYSNDLHETLIGFRYQATGVEGSYITDYPFYPEAVMVNYSDPQHYSLAFNNNNIDEYPLHRVNYINFGLNEPKDIGIGRIFWTSYLIASKYGAEFKIVVKLTPLQINQINYLDIVYISHPTMGNGIYRLGAVEEYNPTTQKALIQLIRIPLVDVEQII